MCLHVHISHTISLFIIFKESLYISPIDMMKFITYKKKAKKVIINLTTTFRFNQYILTTYCIPIGTMLSDFIYNFIYDNIWIKQKSS